MRIPVISSLLGFERQLLDEFAINFADFQPLPSDLAELYVPTIFTHWRWYWQISWAYYVIADDDEWQTWHNGNHQTIWPKYLDRLRHYESDIQYIFNSRVTQLLEDNRSLQNDFISGKDTLLKFDVQPSDSDLAYWASIVQILFYVNLEHYDGIKPNATTIEDRLRSSLESQPPLNSALESKSTRHIGSSADEDEDDEIFRPPSPWEHLIPDPNGDPYLLLDDRHGFDVCSLIRKCTMLIRRQEGQREDVMSALRNAGFDDMYERYKHTYYKPKDSDDLLAFHDPSCTIELIPWIDLEPVLENHQNEGYMWNNKKTCWFDHLLISEEEVFKYYCEHNLTHPDYTVKGKLFLVTTPLKESTLVQDVRNNFEFKWNDIAFTKHPDSHEYLILETVPGRDFRRLWDRQDQAAALQYFRRFVDHHTYGAPTPVTNVLGDISFDPSFQELLDIIPFDQIIHIDPQPLGEGARGLVFKGVWRCPKRIHMAADEDRPVALKVMHGNETEVKARFIKELDNVYTALSGAPLLCIEFYGITRSPSTYHTSAAAVIPPDSLVLVLQHAEHGPLLTHLNKTLRGTSGDWETIFSFIQNIAEGLRVLHAHNIVHRDLHGHNILVRENRPVMDPFQTLEMQAAISDLGEGFDMQRQTESELPYYGNVDAWAPEIRESHKYSPASDMYALGCLIKQMLNEKWSKDEQQGGKRGAVPVSFISVAMRCLRTRPEDHITAKELNKLADDISMMHSRLFDDKLVWEYEKDMIQVTDEVWSRIDEFAILLEKFKEEEGSDDGMLEDDTSSVIDVGNMDLDDDGIPI